MADTPDTLLFTDSGAVVINPFKYNMVWKSKLIGYMFYSDTVNDIIKYRKTTDGGLTWGAAVNVFVVYDTYYASCEIWYDRWTPAPGDTGPNIHICITAQTAVGTISVQYRRLDTDTDTLSATVTLTTAAAAYTDFTRLLSIVKARGGYLYIGAQYGEGSTYSFWWSTDGGATWELRANPFSWFNDTPILMPGGEADSNDIWLLNWTTAGVPYPINFRIYDQSLDTWSAAELVRNTLSAGHRWQTLAAVQRHSDNHVFLGHFTPASVPETGDIVCYEIAGTGSITLRTNIQTAIDGIRQFTFFLDQATEALYAVWSRASALDIGEAKYRRSTDGAVTWGAVTDYTIDTDKFYTNHFNSMSLRSGESSRLYISVHNQDTGGLWTNLNNALNVPAFRAPTSARASGTARAEASPRALATVRSGPPADP